MRLPMQWPESSVQNHPSRPPAQVVRLDCRSKPAIKADSSRPLCAWRQGGDCLHFSFNWGHTTSKESKSQALLLKA